MGLPGSQMRALNRIERTLADDHPGLGPLFEQAGLGTAALSLT